MVLVPCTNQLLLSMWLVVAMAKKKMEAHSPCEGQLFADKRLSGVLLFRCQLELVVATQICSDSLA